jgi:hypothetical protein
MKLYFIALTKNKNLAEVANTIYLKYIDQSKMNGRNR